jgi:hypothetical protein
MANTTKPRLLLTNPADITFTGAAPPYVATFTGPARIHVRGHIWLKGDLPGDQVEIPLRLSNGFRFASNATAGDGTSALFISNKQNVPPKKFESYDGVFSIPKLTNGNTVLSFTVLIPDTNKYFYSLNIIDPKNAPFALSDPIIVNR